MTTPIVPLDPQSPRGRELANGEFADALADVEENVRRRRAEREQDTGRGEAA